MKDREVKNRIIIIGNGFDVAHGIKSTYKDFIHFLLLPENKGSVVDENKFLKHIISKQLEGWVDIEEEYFKALKGEIITKINGF